MKDRETTGVPGLDEVLRGGLPSKRLHLVQGPPGSGKTTLALQFLIEGLRLGQRCMYVTLSESEEEIRGVAQSHGWTIDGIIIYDLTGNEGNLQDREENSLFNPAEVELRETTQPVLDIIANKRPERVVFDSLSELRMLATNPLRYRRRVLALKQHLAKHGCTTLFLDDGSSDPNGDLQLQSLAHGVLEMRQHVPAFGRERRQLQVLKMRGVKFSGGYHDVTIERGGARVFPRLVAADHRAAVLESAPPLSSGLKALDDLLGGGPPRGTSTLVLGPAGSGKSLLMSLYAYAAAERGERSALFLFEEGRAVFMARSEGLGLDVGKHIANGLITVQTVDPAELSPSEFSHIVMAHVVDGAKVIGIDSLNGYMNAMPDERFITLQLHELLTFVSMHGASTVMVMVQHGLFDRVASPVDVSYIADNVVLLRFFESAGRIRKAISVIKKRSGLHETSIRELILGNRKLEVGPALEQFTGVLTGVPSFNGARELLAERP